MIVPVEPKRSPPRHEDTKSANQLTWLVMILCVLCVFVVNTGLRSLGTKNGHGDGERQRRGEKCLSLSPCLRVTLSPCLVASRGVTHPGRTVTVRERGVRRGAVGLTPRPLNIADCQFEIAD